jgi:hypothetical protein
MRSVAPFLVALWAISSHAEDTLPVATATAMESTAPGSADTASRPDTLRVPPPAWLNGLHSAVVPGWGQFSTHHQIRASVLLVLDAWLYADAAQRTLTSIPKLRTTARNIEAQVTDQRKVVATYIANGSDTSGAMELLHSLEDSASVARGRARISADYRNCELGWAVGIHLYGIVDAAEVAWLQRGGQRPVTDMGTAALASALVPGLGQIYNEHYSKAALLYMGVIGAVVSFDSHQKLVDFWKAEKAQALADGSSTTTIDQEVDFFRKRRNQYIWGLGLIYLYQIIDAMVDARLSRVDQPFPISVAPTLPDPGLMVSWSF